ncbi:MAG TPA: hypothetical protein VFT98_11750 [Myxococcota bacterium]|nr:hypothetical protein [Myxococcota bacterium]
MSQLPLAFVALALLPLDPRPAAALPFDATVGIEARGRVDLDGPLPSPPLSTLLESEEATPFTRSVVSVGDAQIGLFDYASSADIGNLALRVSGGLTNSGASALFGQGQPILQAVAEARDVITLTTSRTDPFDVTLELLVSGVLSTSAGSSIGANSSITLSSPGVLQQSDSALYNTDGAISDTLSVTLTVAGPEVLIELTSLLSFNVLAVAAGASVSGDLSNTALLSLILPSDVTIAGSGSGTFGVPITVPEPAAASLLALALGFAPISRALLRGGGRHV